jgi:hypothetical protein
MTMTQPAAVKPLPNQLGPANQPRPTLVEGVLADLEQHIALRDAFKTLMGK